jgi:hypothetical protein
MKDDDLFKSYGKYLAGPIVRPFVGRWDMPESLLDLIPIARLLQILKGEANEDEQGLASEEEAMDGVQDPLSRIGSLKLSRILWTPR